MINEYIRKISSETLRKEEVMDMLKELTSMKNFDESDYSLNREKQLFFEKIRESDFVLNEIAEYCNCSRDEIYVGRISGEDAIDIFMKNGGRFPYSVVVGDLDLRYFNSKEDLSQLKYVLGNLNFSNSKFKNVSNLRMVLGDANFENCVIKDMKKLKMIYGNGKFNGAQIYDISDLEIIGKNAEILNVKIKSLPSLRFIRGSARFSGDISHLPSLEEIGGFASFRNSNIKELPKLKKIYGEVMLAESNIEKLPSLEKTGMAYLNDKIKELPSLEEAADIFNCSEECEKYIKDNFNKLFIKGPYVRKVKNMNKK